MLFVTLMGLIFGSFLNVCIARLPLHESIVRPPSHCPRCCKNIQARDNIPLVSYLILRGRCRNCHERISWRYPAVEATNAFLWLLCVLEFGFSAQASAMAVLCSLALGLAVMDAETMILPDAFTLPGILSGVIWSALSAGGAWPEKMRAAGLSLLWAAAAAGVILLIRAVYWYLRRQEGMGLGDVKLLAMIAAWLGPRDALLVFFLASISGAAYGVVCLLQQKTRTSRLPLGSFLCMATIYAVFEGFSTISWYLGLFR
jgi:leader peptidase (prepilin peptidase)/N-methyltransferase